MFKKEAKELQNKLINTRETIFTQKARIYTPKPEKSLYRQNTNDLEDKTAKVNPNDWNEVLKDLEKSKQVLKKPYLYCFGKKSCEKKCEKNLRAHAFFLFFSSSSLLFTIYRPPARTDGCRLPAILKLPFALLTLPFALLTLLNIDKVALLWYNYQYLLPYKKIKEEI